MTSRTERRLINMFPQSSRRNQMFCGCHVTTAVCTTVSCESDQASLLEASRLIGVYSGKFSEAPIQQSCLSSSTQESSLRSISRCRRHPVWPSHYLARPCKRGDRIMALFAAAQSGTNCCEWHIAAFATLRKYGTLLDQQWTSRTKILRRQ